MSQSEEKNNTQLVGPFSMVIHSSRVCTTQGGSNRTI